MNAEETQKVLKWLKIMLIVLALFLAVQALSSFKSLRYVNPVYNSISVSGEGEVVSIPDVATFSFSVSADAKVASDAQKQVTEKVDVILAELKNLGIEEKDIKTSDYSIWPKYSYDSVVCSSIYCPPSRQFQDGYTVTHGISVKVRKTEDVGKAFSLAGDNGATNLSGISFTVDDIESVLDEARAKAIAQAKDKAEMLARELGVRLVRVVSYYDNVGGGPIPYYAEGMGGDMVKTSTASVPSIPVGENKVTMNVTVIYEIR